MECPRCHFENMPGLTTCFRCGSILTSEQTAREVHPPRAPWIARPFRAIQRILRRYFYYEKVENSGKVVGWVRAKISKTLNIGIHLLGNSLFSAIISLIPGLQQLIDGNFHSVRKYCLTWLILIGVGLFLYGSNTGLFLVGLAIGIHAWIALLGWDAIHAGMSVMQRLRMIVTMIIVLGIVYWFVGERISNIFPHGFSPINFSYYHVYNGDMLMGRRINSNNSHHLKRGQLISMNIASRVNGNNNFYGGTFDVIGQIIGKPMDDVSLKDNIFYVNGKPLNPDIYPTPNWLKGHSVSISVPSDYYFVSGEYTITGHGANEQMIQELIQAGCLIKQEWIVAEMTMRWLPVWRRGYLKELE